MRGKKRHPNRHGQREALDPISGAIATPDFAGMAETGRKFVRLKSPGGGLVEVEFEKDTADPSRDRFGIAPEFDEFYADEAKKIAKSRKKRGTARKPSDEPPTLRQLGIRETFDDVPSAVDYFEGLNEGFFSFGVLDFTDAGEVTSEFMDRLESREGGGKEKRLSETRTGMEILGIDPFSGRQQDKSDSRMVNRMLRYLFGLSKRRRWDEIPWYMVTDYLDQLIAHAESEMEAKGSYDDFKGIELAYRLPVESGLLDDDNFVFELIKRSGPEKAKLYLDWRNSSDLFNVVNQIQSIIRPSKGDRRAKEIHDCLPHEVLSTLRKRVSVLRDWAKYPEEIPGWACVATVGEGGARWCSFPGISADVARLNDACVTPYAPDWWRDVQREAYLSGGEVALTGTGFHPMSYDEMDFGRSMVSSDTEIDEPWDTGEELDEPWLQERVANSSDIDRRNRLSAARDFPENLLPQVLYGVIPERYWRGKLPFDPDVDEFVRVYRSVPHGVTEIRPGDWVALTYDYAKWHGRGHVISMMVPLHHVMWAGTDINEWFYVPLS